MGKQDLSTAKKKEWAQQLFLQDQYTQKEIAAKVGVAEKTLSKWVTKDHWDDKRKGLMVTNQEIIKDLMDTLAEMRKEARIAATDGDPNTKPDSDGIYKITMSIKKLQDRSGIGDIILTIMDLVKFVAPEDHALAQQITHYGDLFIASRLKTL
jgi:hypothetical protein